MNISENNAIGPGCNVNKLQSPVGFGSFVASHKMNELC